MHRNGTHPKQQKFSQSLLDGYKRHLGKVEEEECEDEEEEQKPWEEECSAPGSQSVAGQAENMRDARVGPKNTDFKFHLLHIAERLPKSVRRPPAKTILLSWSFTWFDKAIEMRVMPPMR